MKKSFIVGLNRSLVVVGIGAVIFSAFLFVVPSASAKIMGEAQYNLDLTPAPITDYPYTFYAPGKNVPLYFTLKLLPGTVCTGPMHFIFSDTSAPGIPSTVEAFTATMIPNTDLSVGGQAQVVLTKKLSGVRPGNHYIGFVGICPTATGPEGGQIGGTFFNYIVAPYLETTPMSATTLSGTTKQFQATFHPDGNQVPSQDVTSQAAWSASPSSIADSRGGGVIAGVAVGAAIVQAAYQGVTATSTLNIQSNAYIEVVPDPINPSPNPYQSSLVGLEPPYSMRENGSGIYYSAAYINTTRQFKAFLHPDGTQALKQDITSQATWTAGDSNGDVADLGGGLFKGVKMYPGEDWHRTPIYASYNNLTSNAQLVVYPTRWSCYTTSPGGGSVCMANSNLGSYATSTCNNACVPQSSATLTIAPPSATVAPGTQTHFTAWYDPDGPSGRQGNQDVSGLTGAVWSVSDTSIATSNGGGNVTGVASGAATVQVVYQGITAVATLNVQNGNGGGPDFALRILPGSQNVEQGKTATYNVSLVSTGGFNGAVALSALNLVRGMRTSFTPVSLTGGDSSQMTLIVDSAVPTGSYTFMVRGTTTFTKRGVSKSVSHDYRVEAIVIAPPPGGGGGATSTLVIVPWERTVAVGETVTFTALYDPDGPSGPAPEEIRTGDVLWGSSIPRNARIVGPGIVRGIRTGASIITATYQGITAQALVNVFVSVCIPSDPSCNAKDFLLTVTPFSRTMGQSAQTTYRVDIVPLYGFTESVFLNISDFIPGLSGSFDKVSITPGQSAILTVDASRVAPPGVSNFRVTGTAQGISHIAFPEVVITGQPTHFVCVQNACTIAQGTGTNECGVVGETCGSVSCPVGQNDPHYEKVNVVCEIVSGCGVNDNTCGVPPGGGGVGCTLTAHPPLVDKGGSATLSWNCSAVTSCTIRSCLGLTFDPTCSTLGTVASGLGAVGNQPLTNMSTSTSYQLSCLGGGDPQSTATVRVRGVSETR